jgi:hypothetical protein
MSEKELLKIVTDFRKGILGGKRPRGMCFAVCSPLVSFLGMSDFKCEMVRYAVQEDNFNKVWEHWCLKLPSGRILDPTASQFKKPDGTRMPTVYLGERPAHYMTYRTKKVKYDHRTKV